MDTVETLDGIASLAGLAFIAARTVVVIKICATRTLQEITAYRRHVSNLRRRARENGTGQSWVPCSDSQVLSDGCIAGSGPNEQAAVFLFVNRLR
jgi:hypothetical protein